MVLEHVGQKLSRLPYILPLKFTWIFYQLGQTYSTLKESRHDPTIQYCRLGIPLSLYIFFHK